MDPKEERIVSIDQLPDDPLAMPPPYWRSSGVVFCLLDALESIPGLLAELVTVADETEEAVRAHFEKYPSYERTEEQVDEFSDIMDDLWRLEGQIKTKTLVVVFMSAIEVEDALNQFCVYNLPKDVAESIEKLPPPEKLLVAAGIVGHEINKGHDVYRAVKALTQWRNAFAHGHCVDRPTKSLRHNHLIPPDEYPGTVAHLNELRRLVTSFVRVSEYLASISRNGYTAARSYDVERSKELLEEIARYRFTGDDRHYEITVLDP